MIGRRKHVQWHWYSAEAVKAKAFVLCLIPGFSFLHSTLSECSDPLFSITHPNRRKWGANMAVYAESKSCS